ncbi:ATP-binding protein [Candidatus Uhrbacteria bacterium]|nr:ATP-binding protein [Candidatus Uhrbacteria bacterium]
MAIDPRQLERANAKPSETALRTEEERIVLEEERIYRSGIVSVRDLIAPAAFQVTPDYLQLGGLFVRTLFVIDYPRYINVGWFAPIININKMVDVSMYFYPVKTGIILKQLRKKVGALEAQILSDQEKGAPRDPIRETALRDIEQLRDDLSQGTEKFFQYALYVSVYAKSKEELDKASDEIEQLLGTKLVYSKRVYFQAEQGFNSTLPLNNDELMVSFNMNSSPCASSFPFISSELTSNDGVLYGINRHNNSLILFDRFSLQNANMVVFATSGAGKSYAVKLEVLRALMMGVDVIVIDPEMEYKHLSDAVGGTYINVSLSSDAKVNPFDLPRPVGGGGEEVAAEDIIRTAVITVKGLLKIMIGPFTTQEDAVIDRALLECYAKKDITPASNLSVLTERDMPILQDLQQILDGMVGGLPLAERLKKFTEGTFSGLLNAPTNVQMRNQLVIFSVRDLEDELKPIAIYSIVNYIWNVVRSERKRRELVVDEAWWLMQHEDSAKFIFALVKRCRKYYLGVTTITQDVQDFLTSQYGRAIVTNSAIQLLLKQSPAAIDTIQKTFMLTQGEKYLLLESGPGEGIFFAGAKHVAIKIVASYSEDQLITSDPRQLLAIEESKRAFEDSLTEKEAAQPVMERA